MDTSFLKMGKGIKMHAEILEFTVDQFQSWFIIEFV